MALPPKVNITTSYSAFEEADPQRKLPGQRLDADFSAVQDSVNSTIDVVTSVIKDTGVLRDEIVGRDAFAPGFGPNFGRPRPFVLGGTYPRSSTVIYNGRFYYALVPVNNATQPPVDGNVWEMIGDFRSGLVISEENLAGITDPEAARRNLGLGSMATRDAGAANDQFRNNGLNDQRFLRTSNNLSDLANAEAARENLGLSGAAVTNLVTDLDQQGPGLLGRGAAGVGPVSRIGIGGILRLNNEGPAYVLQARRATQSEAENGADVDAYVTPFLAKQAFTNVLNNVIGPDLFPNGPLFLRADRMAHLRHELAAGVSGPSITSGDWRTRIVNWKEIAGIPGADIVSNKIELPGGMYYIQAVIQSYNVGRVRTRFQRVEYVETPSGPTNLLEDTVVLSESESLAGTASGRNQMTIMNGMFSTSRRSRFEIQQQVSNAGSMGQAASFGGYRECYLDVHIFRLGNGDESQPYIPPVYLGV